VSGRAKGEKKPFSREYHLVENGDFSGRAKGEKWLIVSLFRTGRNLFGKDGVKSFRFFIFVGNKSGKTKCNGIKHQIKIMDSEQRRFT
jgi:hypothetical protein